MRLAGRTARMTGEGADAWEVHDLALARQRAGEDIFLLSIGDPDFETPRPIRDAAVRALAEGRTHYAPSAGEPALRQAIAAHSSPVGGRAVEPEDVTVFPGAQAALFAVAQCLFEPGDEVLVPEPSYVTYQALLGAAGAIPRLVPLRPERRFHLDPEELAAAVTPHTRGVLLNFPHNPTGAVLTRDEAQGVRELCLARDLFLISDEVYAELTFAGPHHSPAGLPGMPERSAVISSFSKSHAMTGWRCGWSLTPPALTEALEKLVRCMFFGVAQFVQDAAVAALAGERHEVGALREAYRARARVVVEGLREAPGVRCREPEAGMYVFADVRGTGQDGKAFAQALLADTGVAVTPGEGFGPSGAGHVRMTLGTGEARLAEACRRIREFCRRGAAAAMPT